MVQFKFIRFKNLGSFGNNFTEINICKHRTTLVSGSNGNGKSFAFLDAITFALFGKAFRKINLAQLPNSINEKGCVVECEFDIGTDKYLVRRGLKPKIFEIHKNGALVNQNAKSRDYQKDLEEQILKMNYKSFTQVVILGSTSFIPFMRLPVNDRRAIIEDILDINVFSLMNVILKGKMSHNKEQTFDIKYQLDLLKEKIALQQKYIETLKSKTKDTIVRNNNEIQKITDDTTILNKTLKGMHNESKIMTDSITTKKEDITNRLSKLQTIEKQIGNNLIKINKDLKFFQDNTVCHTCHQLIDAKSEIVQTYLTERHDKVDEIQKGLIAIAERIDEEHCNLKKTNETLTCIHKLHEKTIETSKQIYSYNNYIQRLQNENLKIETELTESTKDQAILNDLVKEETQHESTKKDLIVEMHEYTTISGLLKDSGIKSKIIQQYLPLMNKLINKYLLSMDFFVKFTLDEEFNETIKSRHRDIFSYMSFSEGEKLRIDLAILLAWREVARIKNSTNTNLLVLDEVFDSSLDTVGTEEFLKLLNTITGDTHVFVVSHKADQLVDKFDASITFSKNGNFSKMTEQ